MAGCCKTFCIQTRYLVIIMCFLGLLITYTLRVNMSVAIVAMVKNLPFNINSNIASECAVNDQLLRNGTTTLRQTGEFDWDEHAQGLILGSFSYLYVLTNLLGGWLSDRFGAHKVIGISIGATSVLNLLTPLAARNSLTALVVVRVLEGLFEGPSFPAMHTVVSRWIPVSERGLSYSLIHSGSRFGAFVAFSLSGLLSESEFLGGWPLAFYFFGLLGMLWLLLWVFLVSETPKTHRFISPTENELIFHGQGNHLPDTKPQIPWKAILTSAAVWGTVVTDFGEGWGFSTILNDLPSYMKFILKLDIAKSGIVSAFPYLLQVISAWLSGYSADALLNKGCASRTVIRKLYTSIGLFAPAICLLGVIFSGCDRTLNIVFFAVGVGLTSIQTPGYRLSIIDMAPNYAGTIMGICNGIGNLSGFMAPQLVGFLTQHNQTLHQWHTVFYVSAGIYLFSGIVFIVFGTATLQSWAEEKEVTSNLPNNQEETSSTQNEGEETPVLRNGVKSSTKHLSYETTMNGQGCITLRY